MSEEARRIYDTLRSDHIKHWDSFLLGWLSRPREVEVVGQPRKHSVAETILNTLSGFIISTGITYWIMPTFYHTTLSVGQSSSVTLIFTVVSVVRSYVWRRLFNYYLLKSAG